MTSESNLNKVPMPPYVKSLWLRLSLNFHHQIPKKKLNDVSLTISVFVLPSGGSDVLTKLHLTVFLSRGNMPGVGRKCLTFTDRPYRECVPQEASINN